MSLQSNTSKPISLTTITPSRFPNMDKITELKTELAVNEALSQEWTFLAKSAEKRNDTSKMLFLLGVANKYAKLALDLKAEINNWK